MRLYLVSLVIFLLLVVTLDSKRFKHNPGWSSFKNTSFHGGASTRQLKSINISTETVFTPALSSPLKIVIAGAPAAGKGTQSDLLKSKYNIVHISTGELLRNAVRDRTPFGLKVKSYMDNAQLVPDDLITEVVCDRLRNKDCCERGWLLDGFPRTKAQAEALSRNGLDPDCFILLDVPQSFMVDRMVGRRLDPLTGKIYHLKYNPPPNSIVTSRLIQRDDDTESKIVRRYSDYMRHIIAIKNYYQSILLEVDGSRAKLLIHQIISNMLDYILSLKKKFE